MIRVEELDLLCENSIKNFIRNIESKYRKGIDMLINNAGVYIKKDPTKEIIDETMKTNFCGTVCLT